MNDSPVQIRPGRTASAPAGPGLLPRIRSGSIFRQNAAEFLLENRVRFGDLVHFRALNRNVYQINHPELLTAFFTEDAPNHHRNLVMQSARGVLGHGLLTSEEPLHMRQRRLAQPAFLRERIAGYAEVISRKTLAMTAGWRAEMERTGTTRLAGQDLHASMLELALRIVSKCLFDMDELDDVHSMSEAVDAFMTFMPLSFLPFRDALQRLPIPAMTRLRRGREHLDRLIYGMIAERRRDSHDRGDLLSMLLSATDTEGEGGGAASASMSDVQLRDECVTVILAGHETTANALSFALHLLAHHPEVQEKLCAEAAGAIAGRVPTAEDYPRLQYARQVFAEAMRLYPPVWVTARTCARAYRIAGYEIPVGATLLAPQYVVHRDARFWEEPERFCPERFGTEGRGLRPRYAYFPFGGGSRQCIGEGLAWMEGTLALALIARDFRMVAPAGSAPVPRATPSVTLRPSAGTVLDVEARG